MDDALIINMLFDRNEKALDELKSKYSRLCSYIAGNILSQHEDVEECVNSAFFVIWKNIPPDTPDDLKTYLCRIVKNKAVDKLKYNSADKRNPQFAVSLEEVADCIPDERGNDITTEKLAELISSFLREQDEKNRKIFVRRYWYGDPLSKIAEKFNMNEKTVGTNLYRTRMKLKDYLKKEGYDV
ncbi:MAG: sigma-70 family RNA polymerase sigma factor [Ruminococcus flavefaciens]|nr:sigma-70 family RNA polymerase sigma factor [Ruminococcus flavefaciens]